MSLKIGVQNVLGPYAKIFYSHHFKARSVGRVSDLIAACVKEKGLDPLSLRGSILYALYIGYCVTEEHLDSVSAPPSFSLEVGYDEAAVFVSLSVHLTPAQMTALGALKAAIESKTFTSKTEKCVNELGKLCESLEVRKFNQESVIELLIKVGPAVKEIPSISWVEAEASSPEESKRADYIELGDVDYLKAMTTHLTGKEMEIEMTETRVSAKPKAEESEKVRGRTEEDTEEKVGGADDDDRLKQKVDGKEDEDRFKKVFSGQPKDEDRSEKKFGGAGADGAESEEAFSGDPSQDLSARKFNADGKEIPSGDDRSFSKDGKGGDGNDSRSFANDGSGQGNGGGSSSGDKSFVQNNGSHGGAASLTQQLLNQNQSMQANADKTVFKDGNRANGGSGMEAVFKGPQSPLAQTQAQTLVNTFGNPNAATGAGNTPDVHRFDPEGNPRPGAPMQSNAALENKIHELQARLAQAEKEKQSLKENLASQKFAVKSKEEPAGAMGFLKSLWPLKKDEPAKGSNNDVAAVFKGEKKDGKETADLVVEVKQKREKTPEEKALEVEDEEKFSKSESGKLFKDLEEIDLMKDGSEMKKVLTEMEKSSDLKLKQWRETLKKELALEKSKMQEMVKNLGKQSRMRENEFLAKERTAASEIRKKDELIRQKESLVTQKAEQLARANVSIERLKGGGSGGAEGDAGAKLKLANATKLGQMKDDENKVLTKKLKDLEDKLMQAQAKSSNGVDPQITAKLNAAEKRVEEFKRMNQRLTESLQKAQDKRGGQEDAEGKRKLEASERLLSEAQKNLEKATQKLKEAQDSERKMAVDLGKVTEENKKFRMTLVRAGLPTGEAA